MRHSVNRFMRCHVVRGALGRRSLLFDNGVNNPESGGAGRRLCCTAGADWDFGPVDNPDETGVYLLTY